MTAPTQLRHPPRIGLAYRNDGSTGAETGKPTPHSTNGITMLDDAAKLVKLQLQLRHGHQPSTPRAATKACAAIF